MNALAWSKQNVMVTEQSACLSIRLSCITMMAGKEEICRVRLHPWLQILQRPDLGLQKAVMCWRRVVCALLMGKRKRLTSESLEGSPQPHWRVLLNFIWMNCYQYWVSKPTLPWKVVPIPAQRVWAKSARMSQHCGWRWVQFFHAATAP